MRSASSSLPPQPPLIPLPEGVCAVGFALADHAEVVSALADLNPAGMPHGAVLKRRAEFLAGRLAARQALSHLGIDCRDGPARREDGCPSWPEPAVGSITHGARRALCAVAHRREYRSLGIDVERLLDSSTRPELCRRIRRDDECSLLESALPLPEPSQVSLLFSAKESLFKCLYPLVGRYMDFHAARLVELEVRSEAAVLAGDAVLELSVDWSAAFGAGTRLRARFVVSAEHVETAVFLAA